MSDSHEPPFADLGLSREDIEAHLDEASAHAAASVGAMLATLPEVLTGELYRLLIGASIPSTQVEALVRAFRARIAQAVLDPARVQQVAHATKLNLQRSAMTLAARYFAEGMRSGRAPDPSDAPTQPGIPSRMRRRSKE